MSAVKYIGFSLASAALATGVILFVTHDKHMARITAVEPFIVHSKTEYDNCTNKKKTTYTKAGDSYNAIGGVTGGVAGAVVIHAITASPVMLVGSAIAGVFGGQALEKHLKKPTAHTYIEKSCSTKYKVTPIPAGYLVQFIYKNESGARVLANKPLDRQIDIALLESALTPEQVISKMKQQNDDQ